ncbi:NTP transferase domain-containing protein [Actinoplanes sp. DH11]|uniref:nucleotidyltransferase family protein n=1 Tax=Actinoplanes sp. DH11 TaxID=2857011 RepID=UPI0021077564|nr:NTP transferase domain-containing protein [Actinoplanes sp. DH11]
MSAEPRIPAASTEPAVPHAAAGTVAEPAVPHPAAGSAPEPAVPHPAAGSAPEPAVPHPAAGSVPEPAVPDSAAGGVAGLVLAAGAGRRYGMPKALVELDGRRLVQHAADTLRAAGCDHVLVVLGAAADQVRATVPGLPATVINPDWTTGMASSLRTGLATLAPPAPASLSLASLAPASPAPASPALDSPPPASPALDSPPPASPALDSPPPASPLPPGGKSRSSAEPGGFAAVVVLLVDMPGVTAEAVRRIIRHAAPDALVMGGYEDRRGHPVLLGRNHWAGVAATATGDRGARDYLRTRDVLVVPVGDVADDRDIDHPDDLAGPKPATA